MKIAVTYDNGNVFQHFGQTTQFKIFAVEEGSVVSQEILDTNGDGHGALVGLLNKKGVDTLICGGIGGGAKSALSEAGIRIYPGVEGDVDQSVKSLLSDKLKFNPDTLCDHHHDEDGEHECGHHGESCGH